MSDSLFDDESMSFLILVNYQRQYSIWPDIIPAPSGWEIAQGPMPRSRCMEWLENNWTDLRPQALQQTAEGTA